MEKATSAFETQCTPSLSFLCRGLGGVLLFVADHKKVLFDFPSLCVSSECVTASRTRVSRMETLFDFPSFCEVLQHQCNTPPLTPPPPPSTPSRHHSCFFFLFSWPPTEDKHSVLRANEPPSLSPLLLSSPLALLCLSLPPPLPYCLPITPPSPRHPLSLSQLPPPPSPPPRPTPGPTVIGIPSGSWDPYKQSRRGESE